MPFNLMFIVAVRLQFPRVLLTRNFKFWECLPQARPVVFANIVAALILVAISEIAATLLLQVKNLVSLESLRLSQATKVVPGLQAILCVVGRGSKTRSRRSH